MTVECKQVELRDEHRRIKPGMFGRVSIVYDRHENVLQVPRSAIVEDMGTDSVFIVEEGKAVRRIVKTGYGENGMIEIIDGLKENDNVVTVGQLGLKPGATVSVINAQPPAETVAEGDN